MPNAAGPANIDLKKDRGLTIKWADGSASYYTIAYLRRMSPSADMRELRKQMAKDPLTVLPAQPPGRAIAATGAELVGNYAIKITFNDGHSSGIYSWDYLRQIDPAARPEGERSVLAPGDDAPPHHNPLGLGVAPPKPG